MSSGEHFRRFAEDLKSVIAGGATDKTQKQQIDTLVRMETRFRRFLTSHPEGRAVYREFVDYITVQRKNILSARPYFRERQGVFSSKIAPALKARAPSRLHGFRANYLFVAFAVSKYKGKKAPKVRKMADEIRAHRGGIIERNLPLAINRAKLFWGKVPHTSTTEYMDLVQTASEGLISAVDKFVPPYTTVFRSVAIGRMSGNMVEMYSDTTLHFYPSDRRELYRANITSYRKNMSDLPCVVEEMNKQRKEIWEEAKKDKPDTPEPKYVTNDNMQSLLRAASPVSMDSRIGGEDAQTMYSKVADPNPLQEERVAEAQDHRALADALSCLTIFEVKVLRLKGVAPAAVGGK